MFATANPGVTLRGAQCGADGVCLDASTIGKHGATPLRDLMTVIASYDTTAGYTSNSLAAYVGLEVGSIAQLNDTLVHDWLLNGDASSKSPPLPSPQSLGSSYGEKPPSDLESLNFTSLATDATCRVHSTAHAYVPNHLAPLSAVEWLRRLVMHRSTQFPTPRLTWSDVEQLLYGAPPPSKLFGTALSQGGMTVSTDLFVQAGVPTMAAMDERAEQRWRFF